MPPPNLPISHPPMSHPPAPPTTPPAPGLPTILDCRRHGFGHQYTLLDRSGTKTTIAASSLRNQGAEWLAARQLFHAAYPDKPVPTDLVPEVTPPAGTEGEGAGGEQREMESAATDGPDKAHHVHVPGDKAHETLLHPISDPATSTDTTPSPGTPYRTPTVEDQTPPQQRNASLSVDARLRALGIGITPPAPSDQQQPSTTPPSSHNGVSSFSSPLSQARTAVASSPWPRSPSPTPLTFTTPSPCPARFSVADYHTPPSTFSSTEASPVHPHPVVGFCSSPAEVAARMRLPLDAAGGGSREAGAGGINRNVFADVDATATSSIPGAWNWNDWTTGTGEMATDKTAAAAGTNTGVTNKDPARRHSMLFSAAPLPREVLEELRPAGGDAGVNVGSTTQDVGRRMDKRDSEAGWLGGGREMFLAPLPEEVLAELRMRRGSK